jgi:hypothetical protein
MRGRRPATLVDILHDLVSDIRVKGGKASKGLLQRALKLPKTDAF